MHIYYAIYQQSLSPLSELDLLNFVENYFELKKEPDSPKFQKINTYPYGRRRVTCLEEAGCVYGAIFFTLQYYNILEN